MTDVAKLRELLAAAAPGPWRTGRLASYHGNTGMPFRCIYRASGETCDTRIFINGGAGERGAIFDADADAALIVAAVNELPALLDEVEFLRAEIARIGSAGGLTP